MKKKTLLIICLLSLLLAVGSFYAATKYIDQLVHETMFAPVVKVASGKQIQPFQPITRADLVVDHEEMDEIIPGSFAKIEDVIGKQSMQTIFGGEQLIEEKLREGYLLPQRGEARYEIPVTNLMPLTELRKGDHVKVWIKYKQASEIETLPAPSHFKMQNTSADLLFESQLVTVKDNNGFEIYSIQPQILPDAGNMTKTFFEASKSTPLNEVEKRYYDYRAQPSAIASFVGFNLTDQEYVILAEAMQYGIIQIGLGLGEEGNGF
ncbi:SAF domain-containing protein [Brevibacillus daliensis]|uniref:SAF domain-containing protein n=1 Tax=Brevibacillus daliensis TaxID=2892995 RepID=UPI001E61E841|nr:SAF domain-containing protein [Brevibacillus daliensis]